MSKLISVDNSDLTIENKKIIQISSYSISSLFLVETGEVYSCGYNNYGSLGRVVATGSETVNNLGLIPDLSDIIQISNNESCSLFLNSSGQVYNCGRNIYGQLGRVISSGSETVNNLGLIPDLSNITQISAGHSHSLFLNSSGEVYSCGNNYNGSLGRIIAVGSETVNNLGIISGLSNITQISAGYDHSLFLNSSKQVYSCGRNIYGQLGRNVSEGSETVNNLGIISGLSNITQISAGFYTSIFLNSSNQIYICGRNIYGQLGRVISSGSATATNLEMISDLSNITQISAGYERSLFLNSSGQVYNCGNNQYGMLGREVATGSETSVNLGMIPEENFN